MYLQYAVLPEKLVNIKTVENRRKPWFTIRILKSIKQKNRLYKKFLSKRDPAAKQKYSKYNNLLQTVIWLKNYYSDLFFKAH